MLGKTHIAVGITASLLLVHPSTVAQCALTIAGGALGGKIPDFDQSDEDDKKDAVESTVVTVFIIAAFLALDCFLHFGMIQTIEESIGPLSIVGAAVFVGVVAISSVTPHRSLTHSIAYAVVVSVAAFVMCRPIAAPIAIGLATHLLLDLFNKRGIMLFVPWKKRVCFGLCAADGKANDVLSAVFSVAAIILGSAMVVMSLPNSGSLTEVMETANDASLLGLSNLTMYLLVVNTLTLAICFLNMLYISLSSDEGVVDDVLSWIINVLALAGGAFGMLAAAIASVLFRRRGGSRGVERGDGGNTLLLVVSISLSLVWVVVYLVASNSLGQVMGAQVDLSPISHVPAIAYAVAVNAITFMLYFVDRANVRRKFHAVEFGLMALALLGGAFGAMVAMSVTGSKKAQTHFKYGIPVMLAANVVIAVYLVSTSVV